MLRFARSRTARSRVMRNYAAKLRGPIDIHPARDTMILEERVKRLALEPACRRHIAAANERFGRRAVDAP